MALCTGPSHSIDTSRNAGCKMGGQSAQLDPSRPTAEGIYMGAVEAIQSKVFLPGLGQEEGLMVRQLGVWGWVGVLAGCAGAVAVCRTVSLVCSHHQGS